MARMVAGVASAMGFYDPDLIIVVGDPGVGKTTLLNGMANYGGNAGDDVFEGVTSWEEVDVKHGPQLPNGKVVRVVDTPGLGGPKGKLTEWLTNLLDILKKQAKHTAGLVLLVDGIVPRIQMSSHIMTQIVPALLNPDGNPWDRICIVVSKCNMESSIFQKVGPGVVKAKLQQGLEAAKCPRMDTFNPDRDIIFCGGPCEGPSDENPGYNQLLERLSIMVKDTTIPDVVKEKDAVKIVGNALAEAVGDIVDGQPVAAVAKNMVQDAAKAAYSGGCCDCCVIA